MDPKLEIKDRLNIYRGSMVEIKERIKEVDNQLSNWRKSTKISPLACEYTALQLRKIYELIGFAAMAADLDLYREVSPKFGKEWKFAIILKNIHKINPDFLPKPTRITEAKEAGVNWHLEDRRDAELTMKDLIYRHGFLSKLLHAKNPFSVKYDYAEVARKYDTWVREVASLLSMHRYVIGPHLEGYIVELHAHDSEVTIIQYQKANV